MIPRWMVPTGLLVALAACGGSGGGSGSGFGSQARLLAVEFPDPQEINPGPETEAPLDAPLVQRIVLVFDDAPNPDTVSRLTVQVRDNQGIYARGRFDVEGNRVIFTPDLPTRPPENIDDDLFDGGGAGLEPDTLYTLRVGPQTWSFIGAVDPELLRAFPDLSDPAGVSLSFRTTSDPARYFLGLETTSPRLVSVHPAPGASNVTPELYSDPDGLFAPRAPLRLEFDRPLNPDPENLGFLLMDLDEATAEAGLRLGVNPRLVINEIDRSVVEVWPSGILPFEHLLSLEYPQPLASLSDSPPPSEETTTVIAATFTTAAAPDEVRDALVEDFSSTDRYDGDPALLEQGQVPAEWNELESGVLTAGFIFDGAGELGAFSPAPPADGGTRVVVLDTNDQGFPLLDGSTPDAPVGHIVRGGVFHFTSIDIPAGVVIEPRGVNPLVLTATESVQIAGEFNLDGFDGIPENNFDSAVTSIPGGKGGAGGGRGGENHPTIFWPPDLFTFTSLVSPPEGGHGWTSHDRNRNGGGGGESGILDKKNGGEYGTNQEISCFESGTNDNNDYGAGGSGGSYLTRGRRGRVGAGNVRPDGRGGWTLVQRKDDRDNWMKLYPGRPGRSPFKDNDPNNDYFGLDGEVKELLGGQGGGGGGSRSEAYYCGVWCRYDNEPKNDEVCGAEFGDPPTFAGSVGDARGGSGGGAGGAVMIQTLSTIEVLGTARFRATGGQGKGGEQTGGSRWGGPSGGGSGGAVVLQSAVSIDVAPGARIDVSGATGLGPGGDGLVQLQPPPGVPANAQASSIIPSASWVDPLNSRNPARFTSESASTSTWFDMGRTIERDPEDTNPVFAVSGLDALGYVATDDDGNVLEPTGSVRCDYLGQLDPINPGQYIRGQEPQANFIPPNASVRLQFQGADAIEEGSKEVDPDTITPWLTDAAAVSSHQFIRYRVTFDIEKDDGPLRANAPRPSIQSVTIDSAF